MPTGANSQLTCAKKSAKDSRDMAACESQLQAIFINRNLSQNKELV